MFLNLFHLLSTSCKYQVGFPIDVTKRMSSENSADLSRNDTIYYTSLKDGSINTDN